MKDFDFEYYLEIPIKVKVSGMTPGRPARLHGPPEDCYPEESPEFDYELFVETKDKDGKLVDVALQKGIEDLIDKDDLNGEIVEVGIESINDAYNEAMERKADEQREEGR